MLVKYRIALCCGMCERDGDIFTDKEPLEVGRVGCKNCKNSIRVEYPVGGDIYFSRNDRLHLRVWVMRKKYGEC